MMNKIGSILSIIVLFSIFLGCYTVQTDQQENNANNIDPVSSSVVEIIANAPAEPTAIFLPFVKKQEQNSYFVSPQGSDSNPGSYSLPWKTISSAVRVARAGDNIYIREGTYHESLLIESSGKELSPIRFLAFPGENPVLDGEFSIPGDWGAMINIRGDYIHISGLEIRNSAYIGIYIYGSHNVVDDVFVHHCNENGIIITHGQYSVVKNSRIWKAALSNEFDRGDGWSSGLSAARLGVSHATISNNTVWESWGEGISAFEANYVTIEDNISYDNYSANIYISDSTNILLQRNFTYTDQSSYVFPYGEHVGIMMGDERYHPPSANITVINNISFGNKRNFYWWQGVQGGGMDNVLIANNSFINSIEESGVTLGAGDHKNVRFTNNLIQQDGLLPIIATVYNSEIVYSNNLWSKTPIRAAFGTNDVIGDPQLIKEGDQFSPEWFRLTDQSPAINVGLVVPDVHVDYFLFPRGNLPDIGAAEYSQDSR